MLLEDFSSLVYRLPK